MAFANCPWCKGKGTIDIKKRGELVRTEVCNNCNGTGTVRDIPRKRGK